MFENLSNVELTVIKSAIRDDAKVIAHFTTQKEKIELQIEALRQKQAELDGKIEFYDNHTRTLTGGYSPLDLCERVSRNGQTVWTLKYPDTIIPVQTQNDTETTATAEQEENTPENGRPFDDVFNEGDNGEDENTQEETREVSRPSTDPMDDFEF